LLKLLFAHAPRGLGWVLHPMVTAIAFRRRECPDPRALGVFETPLSLMTRSLPVRAAIRRMCVPTRRTYDVLLERRTSGDCSLQRQHVLFGREPPSRD
jgi:hypothetical protein